MYKPTSRFILVISLLCMDLIPSSLQVLSQNRRISLSDPFWNFQNSMRSLDVAASIPQSSFVPRPFINGVSEVVSRNILQLAHDIGEKLLEDSTAPTEVFSPLSISGALSLLLLGANGGTYDELMKLMRFSQDLYLTENPWKIHEQFASLMETLTKDHGFERKHPVRLESSWNEDERRLRNQFLNNEIEHRITVANGLFVQNGFSIRPDYSSALTQTYSSQLKNLDFLRDGNAAVQYINEWVKYKTEGKIPQVLSESLNSDTKVVIASVLHFRAMWERTFLEGGTTPRPFYPDGLQKPPITVDMMSHGGSFPYYDSREYNCRVLGLPYKHNLTTMYIILPNDSNRIRLREMQSFLTADKIDEMISKLKMATVAVLFPKMHISNEINLKAIFRKLGVTTLFDQYQGDLSLISNGLEDNLWTQNWSSFQTLPTLAPLPTFPSFSAPAYRRPYERFNFGPTDDSQDDPYIFSRIGEDTDQANVTSLDSNSTMTSMMNDTKINATVDSAVATNVTADEKPREKRDVTYKVASGSANQNDSLKFKDFIVSKRITKLNPEKKLLRGKRQASSYRSIEALKNLDRLRLNLARTPIINPGLYAEEIIHKVDLTVNEKGTDGGAATVTYLYRTGTDAVFRVDTPFLFIIRNDETKLPLFYGTVYEPTNF